MANLENDLNEMFGLGKKEEKPRPIVREKPLPSKEITNDTLPSKPGKKIYTDRNLDKNQLLNRIITNLKGSKDIIPIEVMRTYDLNFRMLKER